MNNDYVSKLNKLRLLQNDKLDIESALFYERFFYTPQSKVKSIIFIILSLLTIEVNITKTEESKIAFLFSNTYRTRNDHFATMNKLESLFPKECRIHPGDKRLYLNNLKYLPSICMWYKKFRKIYSINDALHYTQILLFGVSNAEYIVRIIASIGCNKLITFSDMHLIDSLVVQYCNQRGIITATLQHGNFETAEPFLLSKSKYFLCYGEYTKQKAVSFGANESKFIKVGFIKYIGEKITNRIQANKKVQSIGIILSGVNAQSTDLKMISLFRKYCSDNKIVLKVKCHPHFGKDKYPKENWIGIDEICESEITSQEFINSVDLVIIYSSTVFLECLMQMIPVFIFQEQGVQFYEGFEWCKFRNIDEFCELKSLLEEQTKFVEKKMLDSRQFYSETDNIELRYKKAIESLV